MTPSALAFMLIVWTLVIGMVVYCYSKMFRSKQRLDDGRDLDEPHGDSHDT